MQNLLALLSGGNILGVLGLIWRVERWATRMDARVTYLERNQNGLYDKTTG